MTDSSICEKQVTSGAVTYGTVKQLNYFPP